MSELLESSHDSLNYAFLVHSQKTLTQNLPPRVDNKLLARQKRRRTSPEDHTVLEAAYQQNPKPDKASRTAIVNRVSLGEKEVQIWFQNRRQNDRRKSKPLQPHELLAPRVALEPSSEDAPEPLEDAPEPLEDDLPSDTFPPESSQTIATDEEPGPDALSSQVATDIEEPGPDASSQTIATNVEEPALSAQTTTAQEPGQTPESSKRKRSTSDVQDAKAKSPPSLRISLSFDGEALVRKEGETTPSPPKGRSALRISMSSDGEAVIRADNEPSPSKNRLLSRRSQVARGSLRRSHSAILPATPASTRTPASEKERVFGRSRDPRLWESTFDTDARSALSNSTPDSNSPGLFRSRSQRSLTRSLSSRQNILANHTPVPVPAAAAAPGLVHDKRRKLSRTVSSLGRLESNNARNSAKILHPAPKALPNTSSSKMAATKHDLGDENKENWIPGTRVSNVRRRTTVSHARPVLADSNHKRSRLAQKDTSASQDEDLDCIQGLLSLSQGAWR